MIETADLVLKKAVFEDWRQIYPNLWRHEVSSRYMLWEPTRSEEDAIARMERTLRFQASHPLSWFIYEKRSGSAIGFAGLTELSSGVYEDTGVALGPDFVGRGYGKQVLTALIRHIFDALGGEKLICSCRSENAASRNLQRSCGMVFTHTEDRIDPRNGEPYALEFYEINRFQYPYLMA